MSNFDVNAPRFERNLTMPDRDTILVFAGGLSVILAAATGVWLAFRTRRPPTRIERAEASLAHAATRAEQAARTVRKQAPGIVAERAGRAEKAARHVRKHGPARLRAGYEQTEQAWNRTREMSAEVGNKASETLEKSRKAGAEATSAAQHFGQRLRVRFQRGR